MRWVAQTTRLMMSPLTYPKRAGIWDRPRELHPAAERCRLTEDDARFGYCWLARDDYGSLLAYFRSLLAYFRLPRGDQ